MSRKRMRPPDRLGRAADRLSALAGSVVRACFGGAGGGEDDDDPLFFEVYPDAAPGLPFRAAENPNEPAAGRSETPDPRLVWKRRAGELRALARQRRSISDPCPGEIGDFLAHAERCLLSDRGYRFDPVSLYWTPRR